MDTPTTTLRVRYSETDQMGTFYNSRALEWFEVGRTELLRGLGMPYTEIESRGVMLPLVESHVEYRARARYDDELGLYVSASMLGKARVRFDIEIRHTDKPHNPKLAHQPIAKGYTVHALVSPEGKPIRPPAWFVDGVVGSASG